MVRLILTLAVACVLLPTDSLLGAEQSERLPRLCSDDFEQGADRWAPTDASAWKIKQLDGNKVYNQFKNSKYTPPHRSPLNISLLKGVVVGDFVLKVKVLSTDVQGGGHRDMCLFFGWQDPANFYYVHLGQRPDPNSCQVLIVDDAPRKMITKNKSPGTPWDDDWHQVKIVRRTADGTIEIYFDDMQKPMLTAEDKTFTWGQIGLGSFDNHGYWDDLELHGERVERPAR